jgi:hypothetical protein
MTASEARKESSKPFPIKKYLLERIASTVENREFWFTYGNHLPKEDVDALRRNGYKVELSTEEGTDGDGWPKSHYSTRVSWEHPPE